MSDTTHSNRPAGETDPTTEDLAQQIELLKGDISRLADTLGAYGSARGRDMRDSAEARVHELRGQAEAKVDDLETYVRENPVTALGIAAGLGFLFGILRR